MRRMSATRSRRSTFTEECESSNASRRASVIERVVSFPISCISRHRPQKPWQVAAPSQACEADVKHEEEEWSFRKLTSLTFRPIAIRRLRGTPQTVELERRQRCGISARILVAKSQRTRDPTIFHQQSQIKIKPSIFSRCIIDLIKIPRPLIPFSFFPPSSLVAMEKVLNDISRRKRRSVQTPPPPMFCVLSVSDLARGHHPSKLDIRPVKKPTSIIQPKNPSSHLFPSSPSLLLS